MNYQDSFETLGETWEFLFRSMGYVGFPAGASGEKPACQSRRLGALPGSGKSPGGRHGNPLQYSRLENSQDRGAWQAIFHGVTKSETRLKWLSMHAHIGCVFLKERSNVYHLFSAWRPRKISYGRQMFNPCVCVCVCVRVRVCEYVWTVSVTA